MRSTGMAQPNQRLVYRQVDAHNSCLPACKWLSSEDCEQTQLRISWRTRERCSCGSSLGSLVTFPTEMKCERIVDSLVFGLVE